MMTERQKQQTESDHSRTLNATLLIPVHMYYSEQRFIKRRTHSSEVTDYGVKKKQKTSAKVPHIWFHVTSILYTYI